MSIVQEIHSINDTSTEVTKKPDLANAKPSEYTNGHADSVLDRQWAVPRYKHVMAIHSEQRLSCLSSGSERVSFAGFRNLMVLVICEIMLPMSGPTLIRHSGFKPEIDDRKLPKGLR